MTALDYLRNKYQAMGITLSDGYAETLAYGKCALYDEMRPDEVGNVHRLFVESLPAVLLMPNSVSELGVSISRSSAEAIERYYRLECQRLGLPNRLTEQPKVRFL